jgi:hypothetical protein
MSFHMDDRDRRPHVGTGREIIEPRGGNAQALRRLETVLLEQNLSKTDCGSATRRTRCARLRVGALIVAVIMLLAACGGSGDDRADSDQLADLDFKPDVADPTWAIGEGPQIVIDEAHANFHTAKGRYEPFAELARRDGFAVQSNDATLTSESLANVDILVIANAVNERNVDDWSLPTPSAFSPEEVEAVRGWVEGGGSLLLIVDHMPFPGAAAKLGAAFGIEFNNGFALRRQKEGQIVFEADSGGLGKHPIVHGRDRDESIDHVMSFAGTAFTIRAGTTHWPLLVLPAGTRLHLPDVAWEFSEQTERRDASGMLQGAALDVGRGRVATFGEAGMFTAQVRGEDREPVGMNNPNASHNARFVLNVLHWLAGIL